MHIEILVEDQSGKQMLSILVPKIIGKHHTFRIRAHKGLGRIPKNLDRERDVQKRTLLHRLPALLRGYGKTFADRSADHPAAVMVVCDLDHRCLKAFREELNAVLDTCDPRPETRFCLAIEEGEAWLLGDRPAIRSAYPRAKDAILDGYENDSICGTWEKLADALYPGGAALLSKKGWQAVGAGKSLWAKKIGPHMAVDRNQSPSFVYFRDTLWELVEEVASPP